MCSRSNAAAAALLAFATAVYAAPAVVERQASSTSIDTVIAETDIPGDITSAFGYGFAEPTLVPITNVSSHGPYTGTPTTTGALMAPATLAASISALGPNPTGFDYPDAANGSLLNPEPAPFVPAGGLGTNGSLPIYRPQSDFDFESLALALYQEWIELDLFHYGLATFSVEDFQAAGLTAEDRSLIEFMADQETGHATLLTEILGDGIAPVQCTYNYPFKTVGEFIDFNQKLTRFGESGVYGFLNHLDSRESAQLLLQSITTEARQQMIFRQFEGLFPMPVWFEVGIPQSWAWTLLAPYISSCPANQTRLAWQNFPTLLIDNNPSPFRVNANTTGVNETDALGLGFPSDPANETAVAGTPAACLNATEGVGYDCSPAITHNRSIPLSFPGRQVNFTWRDPGEFVGPNNSYVTVRAPTADAPRFVLWLSQLNATYTPLTLTGPNTGSTYQPDTATFMGDPAVNGTMFVAITSLNLTVTPFNNSMVNPFMWAGPALYQAG